MEKKFSSNVQNSLNKNKEEYSIDFNALFELSNLLNSSLDIQFILDHILLSSMGKMMLTKGCFILIKEKKKFSIRSIKGISHDFYGFEVEIDNYPKEVYLFNKNDFKKYRWLKIFIDLGLKILIPVISKNKLIGVIFFGGKLTNEDFNEKDIFFLRAISNIASTSIENSIIVQDLQRLNRDLDKKIQQLNSLFDIGKEFGVLFEEEKIIKLLSFSLMGQLGVKSYAIFLKENNSLALKTSRIPYLEQSLELLQNLIYVKNPGYVSSYRNKNLRKCIKALKGLNVEIIIPMMFQNETKGILLLSNRLNNEPYSISDIEYASSIANIAMLSIENARLFRETLEKHKLEEEIQIAREIQQGLLPKSLPEIKNYDIFAINISSKQVGGDYFEVMQMNSEEYIIAIADVSGKGIPASLLMANLQATIRALSPINASLTEKTGKINDIIFENTSTSKFITFFWGILNIKKNTFTYVNAGHNPPILLKKDGNLEYLSEGGVILGVTPTLNSYSEGQVFIENGDILFLYTDGVTEAMDKNQNEFGEKKVIEILRRKFNSSSKEIIDSIIKEIQIHSEGCSQYDDITMICIKNLCDY